MARLASTLAAAQAVLLLLLLLIVTQLVAGRKHVLLWGWGKEARISTHTHCQHIRTLIKQQVPG